MLNTWCLLSEDRGEDSDDAKDTDPYPESETVEHNVDFVNLPEEVGFDHQPVHNEAERANGNKADSEYPQLPQ